MAQPLVHALGLDVPNLIPQSIITFNISWARPGGRLIWSSIMLLGGCAIAFWLTTRPKPAQPATWALTVVGAMLTWVLLILGYGTVPHEWLQFAASYLNFGTDTFAMRRNSIIHFDVTRQVVAHIGVVMIYGFSLTTNVILFARWQKRPVAEPKAVEGEEGATPAPTGGGWLRRRLRRTSAYGRPVTVNE
jgi:hypothetical protein